MCTKRVHVCIPACHDKSVNTCTHQSVHPSVPVHASTHSHRYIHNVVPEVQIGTVLNTICQQRSTHRVSQAGPVGPSAGTKRAVMPYNRCAPAAMAWNIYASVYNTVGKRLNTRAAAAQRTRVQDPKGFSDSDHEKPTKSATRTASFCASTSHYAQQNGPMEVYTPPILIHIPTNVEGFILNAGRTPGMKHLLDWHSQNLQSQHAAGKPVILSCDCSDCLDCKASTWSYSERPERFSKHPS